jgi:lipoyl-dependent peroxiredoxin
MSRGPLYTAQVHVTGGRADGRATSSDGELETAIRPPKELGGQGGGTNPEQLFAAGYAACFESALILGAQRAKLPLECVAGAAINAAVSLIPSGERELKLAVTLAVSLPAVTDPADAATLVRLAHQICPYSTATRGNVDVELLINGTPLDAATSAPAS